MRCLAHSYGIGCVQSKICAAETANECCFLVRKSSERPMEDVAVDNGLALTGTFAKKLAESAKRAAPNSES